MRLSTERGGGALVQFEDQKGFNSSLVYFTVNVVLPDPFDQSTKCHKSQKPLPVNVQVGVSQSSLLAIRWSRQFVVGRLGHDIANSSEESTCAAKLCQPVISELPSAIGALRNKKYRAAVLRHSGDAYDTAEVEQLIE